MKVQTHKVTLLIILLIAVNVLANGFYRVSRVIDGDTIVLDDGRTVRLIGVDAPDKSARTELFRSLVVKTSDFLSRLCEDKRVRLEYGRDTTDIYGRTLAYVFLEDGTFINKLIILHGYGYAYLKYPFKYRDEFISAELEARQKRLGLWGDIDTAFHKRSEADSPDNSITVYVTETGTKYHRETCKHLAKSKIAISLAKAVADGYNPCAVCNPPVAYRATATHATVDVKDYTTRSKEGFYWTFWILPFILFFTLIATIAIAWANYRMVENATRPVVAFTLRKDTQKKSDISLQVSNLSNTDAEGIVIMKLFVDGNQYDFGDEAYEGKMIWSLPARQSFAGYKPLDIAKPAPRHKLEASVYYRRWNRRKRRFRKGKVYSAPLQRWEYDYDLNCWVPVIAFESSQTPHEADLSVFR